MHGRTTAVVLPALAVVALVAVVAIASTGSTPGGTGDTRRPSESLYDTIFSLGLVAVVLGGLILLFGLTQRKSIAREVATGKYHRTSLATFLIGVAVFTAVFYRGLLRLERQELAEADQELVFPAEPAFPTLPEEAETSYEPSVSWIPIVVVVGLMITAVVAYLMAERRARRGRTSEGALAEQLALVLDDTLDDLRAEADPRKAIIAAYARLERVLGANGMPRRTAETSDEYLERVLDELELTPAAIGRLTDLFARAKFSQHDVDLAMKEEAISALEHVRDELRRAREAPVAVTDGAPTATGVGS